MEQRLSIALPVGLIGVIIGACSPAGDGGSSTSASGGSGTGGNGGSGAITLVGGGTTCNEQPGVDDDMDGYVDDCNDCDPMVNPAAIDTPNSGADEDCNGIPDDPPAPCDAGITFDNGDPFAAAAAIELCQFVPNGSPYGVVNAQWTRSNGTGTPDPRQHGILPGFGPNVATQAGESLLAISSAYARLPGNGFCNMDPLPLFGCDVPGGAGSAPAGFPQNVPGCQGSEEIHDDIALQLTLRPPSNATGFKLSSKFYSFEFAEWVCTAFNDQMVAIVDPPPEGSVNGNVIFDTQGNPVSVNIAFFDVCDPGVNNDYASECGGCKPQPTPYCPNGAAELAGTGFETNQGEDAGATVWLETTSPITPGQDFTLRLAIWDAQDELFDSTALFDNFEWIVDTGVTVSTQPK